MKKGTIVLTAFPFTNLTTIKRRPAIIVSKTNPDKQDVIIAFISSVIPDRLNDTDLLIDVSTKEGIETGLHKNSIIKADKLLTIEKRLLIGEIGALSGKMLNELNLKLKKVFELR